jgi:DNA-directed RNA polymerase sigma subunit (sigma70/sigma32)
MAIWEACQVRTALYELVGRLPERLQAIIIARYGLGGKSPATYREIGVELGLTGERVRQLHTEALVWLRHPGHSQRLRSLLDLHTLAEYEMAEALAQRWLRWRGGHRGH